jgi:glyoxylase I family protein
VKLAHLMIFVPDLDAARAFYTEVLGFAAVRKDETCVVFEKEGTRLVAFRCDRNGEVGEYSREARAVFVFSVASVEEAIHELRRHGVEVLHDSPAEGPVGRYAAFVDPFGIVHEISEG